MKNKNFFYLQYDKINWENQDKTKINSFLNNYIIKNIIKKNNIKIFDIGFGIGFFIRMLKHLKNITIEGCEPSNKNYKYYLKNKIKNFKTHKKTFLNTKTSNKFDFITAIYVFPHFESNELEKTIKKIHSMLNKKGKFILVVANEKYIEKKLKDKRDLFIEKNTIYLNNKKYKEILHYSDVPEIGKIIDYNREERFYIDLFKKNKFKLTKKKNLNDNGFIGTIFVFEKN